ncbi:MAG TPA: hypothetical protein V6D05_05720, partial [Stenomitos sp.]
MRINESSPRLTLGRPSGAKGSDASTPTPGISSDTLLLSARASSAAAPKIAESLPQPLLSEVGGTSYYVA